jgi:hypothetical protein
MSGLSEGFFKSRGILIFYGFLIIYFTLLSYLCMEAPFWEDEFYTLDTSSYNISGVISQSYNFEGQPPVYFVLLKIWRQIDDGFVFARFLSLLFVFLTVWVFMRLLRLLSDGGDLIWLLIIFLLNPFTVWAALEIRTYSLLIFLSTILIYSFLSYYLASKNFHLYLFLITCVIGLYTQYYFVFLIIALTFSLLVFKGWRAFFKLCLYLIPVVLMFLPNLIFLKENLSMQHTSNPDYSALKGISKVLQSPPKLMLALNLVPIKNGIKLFIILLFIVLAVFGYIKAYKNHIYSGIYFERYNIILVSASVIVILFGIVVVITRTVFADKYMAIAFPLLILLFAIFQVHFSLYRKLIYVTLSISFILLLLMTYIHPVKLFDFKSLVKYVDKIEQKGEPIMFYRNAMSLPFGYYYKGQNQLVPLPDPVRFDTTYLRNIKDTLELRQVIAGITPKSESYLLITDDNTDYAYSVNFNRKMVDEYLNAHFRTTLDTSFFGEGPTYRLRIRRLEKYPDVKISCTTARK